METAMMNLTMMSLPKKSVKVFGELQINFRGRFGIAHLAMLLNLSEH
jgi:hypothetical protein